MLYIIVRVLCSHYRQKSGTKSTSSFAVASSFMFGAAGKTRNSNSTTILVVQYYQKQLLKICFMLVLRLNGPPALLRLATMDALSQEASLRRSVQAFFQHAIKSMTKHDIFHTLPIRSVFVAKALLMSSPIISRSQNLGTIWRFAVYILKWRYTATAMTTFGSQQLGVA